jgi:nucleotide-binding universal stress UspA family protein
MPVHGPLLLPLDGSDLAEGALPYALALARAMKMAVLLVSVFEAFPEHADANVRALAADAREQARAHATAYLERVRRQIGDAVPVTAEVREGDAPDEILKAVKELGASYLAMSTHGRAGISRWRYGSTAGQLLHASPVPMLVVGPRVLERHRADVTFEHIMVPLDGRQLSEVAIPVAQELAEALGARISLVEVVGWAIQTYPYALPDAYLPQLDQDWEAAANEYLRIRKAQLKSVPVEAFVLHGPTTDALMGFIGMAVDLVVMATRARTGLARAVLGSVADRMLHAEAPVMLVRPED